jgi:hypothetical protein
MKSRTIRIAAFITIAVAGAVAAGKSETFTGEVSDAMCGAKHMMPGNAACLRTCVSKGANYALVAGDKVYTLHTSDESARKTLDQLAGEKAKVTGTADGDTIEVSKVGPAK